MSHACLYTSPMHASIDMCVCLDNARGGTTRKSIQSPIPYRAAGVHRVVDLIDGVSLFGHGLPSLFFSRQGHNEGLSGRGAQKKTTPPWDCAGGPCLPSKLLFFVFFVLIEGSCTPGIHICAHGMPVHLSTCTRKSVHMSAGMPTAMFP